MPNHLHVWPYRFQLPRSFNRRLSASSGDLEALTRAADQMRIVGGTVSWAEVERRSSKTGQSHSLGGFTGSVDYQGDYQGDYGPFLPWLRAARWTGVGRQTVWGKGSIEAVEVSAARA